MNLEELALLLRAHSAEIKEADEWRPLAQHVLDLVQYQLIDIDPYPYETLHFDLAGIVDELCRLRREKEAWGEERNHWRELAERLHARLDPPSDPQSPWWDRIGELMRILSFGIYAPEEGGDEK